MKIISILLCTYFLSGILDLNWKTKVNSKFLTINSTFDLNNKEIDKIIKIYFKSKKIFKYRGVCLNNPVTIKIISTNILRNKRYFYLASSLNFGRYFSSSNTIYIIKDVFNHPEYLAHELAHHFYNSCNIIFNNKKEENFAAYKFQAQYKQILKYNEK